MHDYSPYLSWIDTQKKTLLKRVKQWASINSFSHNPRGLERLFLRLQRSFATLEGTEIPFPHSKLLLLIHKRPEAPIQVLLGGHFDTVYSPSSPFQKIEEKEHVWKGPGVADMKGGLAILLTTLEAFERSPFAKTLGWKVFLNPDEEIGSPTSSLAIQSLAPQCHAGLIFEPSLSDGSFISQRKGSVNYTLTIKGRAAHVGRHFNEGKSAVFTLARWITWLEKLQNDAKDLTVNVAELEGAGPLNIVPPFARCRINIRCNNSSLLQQTCQKLEQKILQDKQEGIQCNLVQDSFRPPKVFDLATQRLFEAYATCAYDLGLPFQTKETGGVSDGNNLSAEGLPTLDTAGVVGGNIHTPEEYVVLSSLTERAKLATLFLFKLASGEINLKRNS